MVNHTHCYTICAANRRYQQHNLMFQAPILIKDIFHKPKQINQKSQMTPNVCCFIVPRKYAFQRFEEIVGPAHSLLVFLVVMGEVFVEICSVAVKDVGFVFKM